VHQDQDAPDDLAQSLRVSENPAPEQRDARQLCAREQRTCNICATEVREWRTTAT
jgi:hypothetical protein